MLDKQSTKAYLEGFNKYVIQQARTNLTKGNHNASKELYNSFTQSVIVSDNSFESGIYSSEYDEYGKFQDLGVRGKKSAAKAPNSPFKFGSGTGKKGGLSSGINRMVKKKGFQFKDKKSGRFLSFDSTAYLITRSIYNKGLRPLNFLQRPFELAFAKLPDELLKAYGLDIESHLKYIMK